MERIFKRERELDLQEVPDFVLQNAYNEVTENLRDLEMVVHEKQVTQLRIYEELQRRRQGADAPLEEVAD